MESEKLIFLIDNIYYGNPIPEGGESKSEQERLDEYLGLRTGASAIRSAGRSVLGQRATPENTITQLQNQLQSSWPKGSRVGGILKIKTNDVLTWIYNKDLKRRGFDERTAKKLYDDVASRANFSTNLPSGTKRGADSIMNDEVNLSEAKNIIQAVIYSLYDIYGDETTKDFKINNTEKDWDVNPSFGPSP